MLVGLGALAMPMPAAAQIQGLRRIAFLSNDPSKQSVVFQAFTAGLRDLGWIEGKNIQIDFHSSAGKDARYPEIAARVVRDDKVDLIATSGSAPTRAAMAVTDKIPIVFGSTANPVEQGFVKRLAKPGRNVTGLALLVKELGKKRWQLLKEVLPQATRFARLYNAESIEKMQPAIIKDDAEAERMLGVTVEQITVSDEEKIGPALVKAARSGIEGMHVTAASLFVVNRALISKIALEHKLPILGPDRRYPDDGILASYGENFGVHYRRAAFLVDKILRGTTPAEIPVEISKLFEFVINLRTARAFGIKVPEAALLQADHVIK